MNGLRPICLAFALALGTLVGALGAPPHVAFAAPLPPPQCRYQDVITRHSGTGDWAISLLDPTFMVGRNYVPPQLVSVANANIGGSGRVRKSVIPDLRAMAAAARQAGAPLTVNSAYRSYSQQASLYRREVDRYGEKVGRESVARPGHSEHQLGTTIDFGSGGQKAWAYNDWANTKAGSWIKANGWRFGFVMSYPDGRKGVTCYRYEPWHYRYVGRERAADVRASQLTLREYLWKHYH